MRGDLIGIMMMDMMLTVRDDTVDLLPVVAMALIGIMMRTTDVFKVRPVILLKVSSGPRDRFRGA